ncbi:FRG domain-containing protein [Luteitalea sp.]
MQAALAYLEPPPPDPLVEPITFSTYSLLKEHLWKLAESDWIFRGQSHPRWPISSLLERRADPVFRSGLESQLVFEYDKAAHNYMTSEALPKTRFDTLAALQHHGAPTRLIDFTRSFYVALFFALEQETEESFASVWAINERAFHDGALLRVQSLDSVQSAPRRERLAFWLYKQEPVKPYRVAETIGLAAPAGLQRLSQRQAAQQAIFLVPGDLNRSAQDNIRLTFADDNGTVDEQRVQSSVKQFLVDNNYRKAILRELRHMNISRATLYPGLDGYTQSLSHLVDDDSTYWRRVVGALPPSLDLLKP